MRVNKKQTKKLNIILKDLENIEAGGLHGQLPVIWDKAKGAQVWDIFGNVYIDFTSTIFVTNCGHGAIADKLAKQVRKLIHSYTFPTLAKQRFLKDFKKFLPAYCEKIFLASAGSEVTSWAINLMRAYRGKKIIVHIDGAFHGKTGSIENLSHEELRISFDAKWNNDIESQLNSYAEDIAGIMIESYQGWSARFMDKEFIQNLVIWAKNNNIPVCFDEIQGGFYRTGTKFAYEHYGIEPDLVCMGKGLGGGFPISALAGLAKYFQVEGLSSTHSGTPLGCTAAREALKVYTRLNKEELAHKSQLLSDVLHMFANSFKCIQEVQCKGLIASVIFSSKEIADKICLKAMDNGLLVVRTGRESIKLGPPLIMDEKMLLRGLDRLEFSIKEIARDLQ